LKKAREKSKEQMGMVERCRGLFDSDEGQTRMHRISVADCVFPGMETTGLCKNAVLINRNCRLLYFLYILYGTASRPLAW